MGYFKQWFITWSKKNPNKRIRVLFSGKKRGDLKRMRNYIIEKEKMRANYHFNEILVIGKAQKIKDIIRIFDRDPETYGLEKAELSIKRERKILYEA